MKIAIEELAGCSGCTIAVLDLHEMLLDVVEKAEIVYSPVIMDVKEPPEGIDIAFVTGAVRNEENRERLKMIRKRSKVLVALGTCACYGGVSGLSMLSSNAEIFNKVYRNGATVGEDGKIPSGVPPFTYRAFAVGDLAMMDYYITGCPPKENFLREIIPALIAGDSLDLSRKSVCSECDRKMGSVEGWKLKRRYEGVPDREHCLLGQGYLCLGPVTFGRCGASCPKNNVPCHGCNGPSLDILREPCRDLYNMMVRRISDLTDHKEKEIEEELYDVAHTMYPFTIGSLIMEDKENSKIRDLVKERSL
ncbi:NADH ubiquinone oxidoreductase 20 kDa subunit [Methanolacinia petrolearia DSM 11571]|uniref:NADH ubiquinone oxidoreductase 20 kDa subunit n=2 Tax=Methanolacinia TaxID=230355 RepID=E1RGT3_METP4|nr:MULTISPECIES: NADH ubiquinone oxidoreductase [Methanolacinia]ADN37462.1 NADH ubiquinone oxidoreductase 20 kDa subunit [Methanolacinia petrolearia DSM 11571]